MSTRHNNHVPLNKGSRVQNAPTSDRQRAINAAATTDRVVVIDSGYAVQDIIRISIETVRSARLPERVIMF